MSAVIVKNAHRFGVNAKHILNISSKIAFITFKYKHLIHSHP